jgi:Cys-tRNA(Pro)/Cys-tRNA(Cys) deacylase
MAKQKDQKTLAMKLLDGKKITYDVRSYPTFMRDAGEIAAELGVPATAVYKTLVAVRPKPGKSMLVMIAADRQLNLKKLAKAVGEKKVHMATHQEAERLTGLQVGGISALALINKGFAIFIDEPAREQEHIFISAGQRGLQIELAVDDLVKITRALFIDVTQ